VNVDGWALWVGSYLFGLAMGALLWGPTVAAVILFALSILLLVREAHRQAREGEQ
jgi:hypothetical protein